MLEKTQLDFHGTIGSNVTIMNQERLSKILLNLENDFNAGHLCPLIQGCRIHIFSDNKPKRKKNENKKRTRK